MPKKPSNAPEVEMLIKLFNLGSVILILGILGYFLDRRLHTLPLFIVIGIILGMLYSFYEAWQIYKAN